MGRTTLSVIAIASLTAIGFAATWKLWAPRAPFDPATWKASEPEAYSRRKVMAEDLIARGTLDRLTLAETTALLGAPTETDKFRDWDLVYVLEPQGIDFWWLVIRFDSDGIVREYEVVGD